MAQVFDPVPSDHPSRILCCYINATSKIQIVRITNIVNWYFERVVFPGQRLIFEALTSAQLEVHSGAMASAILSDTIPCQRLRINTGDTDQAADEQATPNFQKPSAPEAEVQSIAFRDSVPRVPAVAFQPA
ncbi:MAG: DUF1830 domain-containing protein [Elainellaceae cyanobacterium]